MNDPRITTIVPASTGISATGPAQNTSQDNRCMTRPLPSPGQWSCPGIVHPVPLIIIEVICAAWAA
jgi:hypothetical protein